jgi:hypothetical protein
VIDRSDIQTEHLKRFIDAIENPPAEKRFFAAAVICETLLEGELVSVPDALGVEYALLVIGIPDLKKTYTAVFAAAGVAQ